MHRTRGGPVSLAIQTSKSRLKNKAQESFFQVHSRRLYIERKQYFLKCWIYIFDQMIKLFWRNSKEQLAKKSIFQGAA